MLLLVVVTVLANLLLTVLETALCRGTVLRVISLLIAIALLAILLLRLLVALLLVASLVVAALLGVWAVTLRRVLLLVAVALVVLIVTRHVDVFQEIGTYRSRGGCLKSCVAGEAGYLRDAGS